MSYKFWDLPQKYEQSPVRNKKDFLDSIDWYKNTRYYRLHPGCFSWWLFYSPFQSRTQKCVFSDTGDQLLENVI